MALKVLLLTQVNYEKMLLNVYWKVPNISWHNMYNSSYYFLEENPLSFYSFLLTQSFNIFKWFMALWFEKIFLMFPVVSISSLTFVMEPSNILYWK